MPSSLELLHQGKPEAQVAQEFGSILIEMEMTWPGGENEVVRPGLTKPADNINTQPGRA